VTTTLATPQAIGATRRSAIAQLARIETRSMLRRASIWTGVALTVAYVVIGARAQEDWSSQRYQSLVPLAAFPMTMATFVAGVRSGNRDRSVRSALADEAPLGGDQRTVARLASLVVPVGFVTLVMIAIGVGSRIEGGFRVGDGRFRTDSAVHSVVELLQPPLVIAVVGAAAIATGRWVFRAGPAIVIGVVVLFMTGSVYWMWNAEYAYSTALMQVHPLGDLEVVHTPTVMLHDLYLLGLVGLFVGLSLRDASRPRWVVGGAVLAGVSVAAQLAVSPL
jgi:hypothetical protein